MEVDHTLRTDLLLPMLVWRCCFSRALAVPDRAQLLDGAELPHGAGFRHRQLGPDAWPRRLWDAYLRTFGLATAAAVITSALAFPCAYAIAFKLSETARRWAVFLMVIPFFTSYLVRVYSADLPFRQRHHQRPARPGGARPYGMLNSISGPWSAI